MEIPKDRIYHEKYIFVKHLLKESMVLGVIKKMKESIDDCPDKDIFREIYLLFLEYLFDNKDLEEVFKLKNEDCIAHDLNCSSFSDIDTLTKIVSDFKGWAKNEKRVDIKNTYFKEIGINGILFF